MFIYCNYVYLAPVFDVAGGLKAISDSCNFALFSVSCAVLTSAASAKSFRDFFSKFGSSTLRHPIHLQLPEQGILA